MAILNVKLGEAGLSGVKPRLIYIETDDSVTTVLGAGYLNAIVETMGLDVSTTDLAVVATKETPASASVAGVYGIAKSGSNWTLIEDAGPGQVKLPTRADYVAHFKDVNGTLTDELADINIDGSLTVHGDGAAVPGAISVADAATPSGLFTMEGGPNLPGVNVVMKPGAHAITKNYTIYDLDVSDAENSILVTDIQNVRTQSNTFVISTNVNGVQLNNGPVVVYAGSGTEQFVLLNAIITTQASFSGDTKNIKLQEEGGGKDYSGELDHATILNVPDINLVWGGYDNTLLKSGFALPPVASGSKVGEPTTPGKGFQFAVVGGPSTFTGGILNVVLHIARTV